MYYIYYSTPLIITSYNRIKRSVPFFKVLLRSKKQHRLQILKNFPSFVMDDIIEILINIVRGNVKLPMRYSKIFRRQRKTLLDITHSNNKRKQRQIIYTHNCGFIASLLPIITTVIGTLLGGVI